MVAALREGYSVRTTLRSLKRADEVRQMMKAGGIDDTTVQGIEFCVADLTSDDGWQEACKGCKYVLHVASPFPAKAPKDPNELIKPAKEGTLRALRAAKAAGTVKRVVVTSSFAAIGGLSIQTAFVCESANRDSAGYGHPDRTKPFTEEDWSNLNDPSHPVPPYQTSKTLAERAAWDWIEKEGGGMELAVVNPVGIFGPLLSSSFATSIELVIRMMNGSLPGMPYVPTAPFSSSRLTDLMTYSNISAASVDARDCADLHLKAMVRPEAAGQRFLAVSDDGALWMKDMALLVTTRPVLRLNESLTERLSGQTWNGRAWLQNSHQEFAEYPAPIGCTVRRHCGPGNT
jgi:nucleoside-diphosphate-sugar epimerase